MGLLLLNEYYDPTLGRVQFLLDKNTSTWRLKGKLMKSCKWIKQSLVFCWIITCDSLLDICGFCFYIHVLFYDKSARSPWIINLFVSRWCRRWNGNVMKKGITIFFSLTYMFINAHMQMKICSNHLSHSTQRSIRVYEN